MSKVLCFEGRRMFRSLGPTSISSVSGPSVVIPSWRSLQNPKPGRRRKVMSCGMDRVKADVLGWWGLWGGVSSEDWFCGWKEV